MSFDTEFQEYLDFGRKLTAYYYEERYPPGPLTHYSKKEIEKVMKTADDIMTRIRESIEKDIVPEDQPDSST